MSDVRTGNIGIVLVAIIIGVIAMGTAIVLGARDNPNNPANRSDEKVTHGTPEEPEQPPVDIKIPLPDFVLDEISGEKLGLADLKGKVWVADFIFTRCAGTCPEMTKTMKSLQDRIEDLPDVRLVSISVDPKYDTVEALREYAQEYECDRTKWKFLKGDGEAVHELAWKHFKLGDKQEALAHSTRFALVDQEGRIRGYYEGVGPTRSAYMDALEQDIRKLLKGEPLD